MPSTPNEPVTPANRPADTTAAPAAPPVPDKAAMAAQAAEDAKIPHGIPHDLANVQASMPPIIPGGYVPPRPAIPAPSAPQPMATPETSSLRPLKAKADEPATWPLHALWEGPQPEGMADTVVAYAYVNHGRWVVDCPFCLSAQLTSPRDRRFFCVECGNVNAGGRWLRVQWPDADLAQIEKNLGVRPRVETRNWTVGESVLRLQAENTANGLPTF